MSVKHTHLLEGCWGEDVFAPEFVIYHKSQRCIFTNQPGKNETIGWKHLNIISWSLVDTLKLESSHAWKTKLDSYQILVIVSNQNSARRATHSLVVVTNQLICSSVEWKVPAKSRFYFLDKQFHVCKCHKFDIGVKKLVSYLNHKILRKRIKWIVLQLHHSRLHFLDKQFHL